MTRLGFWGRFSLVLLCCAISTAGVDEAVAAQVATSGTAASETATKSAAAKGEGSSAPTRYSFSLSGGNTYLPDDDLGIGLATFAVVLDYDRVWPHRAPEGLRFKVEASAGAATEPHAKFIGSIDMLALLYSSQKVGAATPYVEAGVGVIYTDFKRPGQGLSVNFHPVAGAGLEFERVFLGVRFHHLSNGKLYKRNKPMDYLMVLAGFYF